MINTIGQLFGTALLCRVLPKVKPPCTYSLVSIRAQIAALKMSMVLQAGEQAKLGEVDAGRGAICARRRRCWLMRPSCRPSSASAAPLSGTAARWVCRRAASAPAFSNIFPQPRSLGDATGNPGRGQWLLLRHGQHLDLRGCRQRPVQGAVHHLHERLGSAIRS